MVRKKNSTKWAMLLILVLLPSTVWAEIATLDEARTVAENWIRFIVERDGHWAGSTTPVIKEFAEFTRGKLLLGYFASVRPQGYIVVSFLKDFTPIKAYSTTSRLDPGREIGMCALLKDELENRLNFLVRRFGGLDEVSLQRLHVYTPHANRLKWAHLLEGGRPLRQNLESIYAWGPGRVGPLLETRWGQGPPYNDDCPDMGCNEHSFNRRAKVGCVAVGMAQVMRYFAWPPGYDWGNMLEGYSYDRVGNWFRDDGDNPVTQQQIDAVARLCWDSLNALEDTGIGCSSTGGHTCDWWYHDARDALQEDFFMFSPECKDYNGDNPAEWWDMIRYEIDRNRPMLFRIANEDDSFRHVIVVDGYDNAGLVHANYGGEGDHDAWYGYDAFDCDSATGYQGGCDSTKYQMVRLIYPMYGLCGSYSGNLGPLASFLHHYVYCDLFSSSMSAGGASIQFLPGASLNCTGSSIRIYGYTDPEGISYPTRLFTDGLPTRGVSVNPSGSIKLNPNGGMKFLPLGAPRYLSVTQTSLTEVDLSWVEGYGNQDGFVIDRKSGSASYSYHTTVSTSSLSDAQLAPATRYCYRIMAMRQDGARSEPREICAATQPSLRIIGDEVLEGDYGTSTLSFLVQLQPPVGWTVNVDYATSDGTAQSNLDYIPTSGTLIFNPNEIQKFINVSVISDTQWENDETFSVNLSNPINATLFKGFEGAKGSIYNDDVYPW